MGYNKPMSSYETILSIWHKTLSYSNIFDYPLTKDEIYQFAITDRPVTPEAFEQWFSKNKSLLMHSYAHNDDEYWAIAGRGELFPVREARNTISQKKTRTTRLATLSLFLMPWVQLIAITGTTAAGNARAGDDVDLYVVTSPKRTWLTRFLILSYFALIGRRHNPKKQTTRTTFCLNHVVDTNGLEDPHHDLYIASEISRMRVLWERGRMFAKLLAANDWITVFLPHWYASQQERLASLGTSSSQNQSGSLLQSAYFIVSAPIKTPFILVTWLLDGMEEITRKVQQKRFKKLSGVEQDRNLLTVHQHDNRQWILREFGEVLLEKG